MESPFFKKAILGLMLAAGLWLGIRYALPLLLPFVLGGLLALAAEPAVAFGVERLKLKRPLAAGLGVTLTLAICALAVWVAAAATVRELGQLAKDLPDLQDGTDQLRQWLSSAASKAPQPLRAGAKQLVVSLFDESTPLMRQVSDRLPSLVGGFVSRIGSLALAVGTGLLAAFLISARLPALRDRLTQAMPDRWRSQYLPTLKRLRSSLWGWLKAQLKLSSVTWGILTLGFWILGIPRFPLWAVLIALVDAIPILGTGTVLVPWSVVSFLREDTLLGVGLLCTYGAAAVTRTVLEPKLVGKHLGLDPLTTLLALYTGFRLWGFGGLLFTPILASAAKSLLKENTADS